MDNYTDKTINTGKWILMECTTYGIEYLFEDGAYCCYKRDRASIPFYLDKTPNYKWTLTSRIRISSQKVNAVYNTKEDMIRSHFGDF